MSTFWTPANIFVCAILLRVTFFSYGLIQDKYAALPYTDIDYFVFTDAARYVSHGDSPYDRETYRYTPLLAWILLPTAWQPQSLWFSFGKLLFAAADILAGWLIFRVLRARRGLNLGPDRAIRYAAIWLLNPMVATISTRGSSEGLLGVIVVALLWAVLDNRIWLAGAILGFGVHFKIYPFIYGASIFWYLENTSDRPKTASLSNLPALIKIFLNMARLKLFASSLLTFCGLNALMYTIYGQPFLQHTFLHHLTRIDHRHNFSPYNTLLHLSSAYPASVSAFHFESLAFVPQLLLSTMLLPFVLAKRDLAGTMLAQTWAFVAFNKVVTSQYFLWYIILLPFYLPYSSLVSKPRKGLVALLLWAGAQAGWLHQAYALEFLGQNTFFPGLWVCGLLFFGVNCWILSIMIGDIGRQGQFVADAKAARKGE